MKTLLPYMFSCKNGTLIWDNLFCLFGAFSWLYFPSYLDRRVQAVNSQMMQQNMVCDQGLHCLSLIQQDFNISKDSQTDFSKILGQV